MHKYTYNNNNKENNTNNTITIMKIMTAILALFAKMFIFDFYMLNHILKFVRFFKNSLMLKKIIKLIM